MCCLFILCQSAIVAGPAVHVQCVLIASSILTVMLQSFADHLSNCMQEWEYPRENLIYLRELGEGQYGKVHLMKAKVSEYACYRPLIVFIHKHACV